MAHDEHAVIGRFAPSPTGVMHAGNIFAYLMSWLMVKAQGGSIVLRIEDLDRERSKPAFSDKIMRDFEMLGLTWDRGPYYQQGREEAYEYALSLLRDKGLVYPCFCTRADLHAASAPHRGEKLVYPGTCRNLSEEEIAERLSVRNPAVRLRVDGARECYELDDFIQGHYAQDMESECGDFIVRRSDGAFAYQLAVVVDDAEQGVNLIVRGMDLLCSTPQQLYLQDLLGYDHPTYAHIPLFVSKRDRRLSKRDKDAGIDEMLEHYKSPEGIIGHIAYVAGLISEDMPMSCEDLLAEFDWLNVSSYFPDKVQIQWR